MPITLSPSEVSSYYAARVPHLKQRGKRWRGPCPVHGGKRDNFSVDSITGLWRCWSDCWRGGDIVGLEMALTSAVWREAVVDIERVIGRVLLYRAASRAERRALAERREREQQEIRAAEFFRIAADSMAEQILYELPETVPERYAPTQLLLSLRAAHGAALLALYHDWREREPQLTAGLVYAGERAWNRLCTRLARFIHSGAGAEVRHVA